MKALAARLLGAVEAIYESLGTSFAACGRPGYPEIIDALRESMNESAFERQWQNGRKMTLEGALSFAGEQPGRVPN